MATSIRVSEATRAKAAALAAARGMSIAEVVEEALEGLDAADFWRITRRALAAGRAVEEGDEGWDRTVRDEL